MQIEERGRDRSRRDRVQTWSTKKIGQWTAVVQNIETSKNNIFVKIAILGVKYIVLLERGVIITDNNHETHKVQWRQEMII